jgi:hypothetical protein
MSLRQWQQLAIAHRAALVRAPLLPGVGGFVALALASGAKADAFRPQGADTTLEPRHLQCLQTDDSEQWLACATPFARYVLKKIAERKPLNAVEAAGARLS